MSKAILDADEIMQHATPITHQHGHEIQPWGHIIRMPIALWESACKESVENLNQLLADTMTLGDLYKKHHWQVSGPTFYQLHLLFDKHYVEQARLIDAIAERIQPLGSVGVAMAPDVAETTLIPRLWLSRSRYSRRSTRVQRPAILSRPLQAGHSPSGNATPAVHAHHTRNRRHVYRDHVIKALVSDRADDALHICVLPRRSRCRSNGLGVHRAHGGRHMRKDRIAIME